MGSSLAIPIVMVVVIGLVIGSLINFATAPLAIPLVAVLLLNFVLVRDTMDRQKRLRRMRAFRHSARARKIDLTEQDRRTVI